MSSRGESGEDVAEQPQFRSLSRDERRDRIVRAAKLVLLEKGLDASSMDDVAARAGTTKPTVYAHFKSKDELFSAVVEYMKGLFLGKLRSPDVYATSASPWPPPPDPPRSPGRSMTPCTPRPAGPWPPTYAPAS
jgi:AcrR family transcriptional regulator